MNKILLTTGLIAASLSMAPIESQACGATLFGTAQGARFHAYRARVPADVLIYASPQLADSSATTEPGIQEGLQQAGHRITVVTDADSLAAALKDRHYDVVIAGAGDADAVASQLDGSGKVTSVLPIVDKSSGGRSFAPDRYAQTLRASAGIGQFLKAINKLMEVKIQ